MSALDVPLGLAAASLGIGAIVGYIAFAAVCELVERIRR